MYVNVTFHWRVRRTKLRKSAVQFLIDSGFYAMFYESNPRWLHAGLAEGFYSWLQCWVYTRIFSHDSTERLHVHSGTVFYLKYPTVIKAQDLKFTLMVAWKFLLWFRKRGPWSIICTPFQTTVWHKSYNLIAIHVHDIARVVSIYMFSR